MKTYKIIAKCDPYNSQFHYNGQSVVKYDGATPVAWVVADSLTLDEAKKVLEGYILEEQDVRFEDAESINALRDALVQDEISDEDLAEAFDWYSTPGYYLNNVLVFDPAKDMAYSCDTVTYFIE